MATNGAEIVASELMVALLTGEDVTIPDIDISGSEFDIPGDNTSDAYDVLVKLDNADLTTGAVNGTGSFDKLMVGIAAQLQREFDASRITGAEYAKAYIALTQGALSTSLQFLLGKDASYWQAVQAQTQAVIARVQLATVKAQNATAQIEALNAKANYSLTKLKLASEDAQYGILKYKLENIDPLQVAQLVLQNSGITITNDTAEYNLDTMLPKQYELLTEQVLSATKDTQTKEYTYAYILPIQRLTAQEQAEAARAQTMDVRSDNITAVAGSIGKQNSLYAQQIVSYQKDSQLKAAKVFSDVWITCRSIDEGFPLPTQFDTAATQAAMQAIITANGLG